MTDERRKTLAWRMDFIISDVHRAARHLEQQEISSTLYRLREVSRVSSEIAAEIQALTPQEDGR